MLTLFRVMTFEDWTDVMYSTQEVYSWSWIFYLTFIFFTAFAFLNMVIGIVVNVMEEEHTLQRQQNEPSMQELMNEITALKAMLQNNSRVDDLTTRDGHSNELKS